MDENEEPCPCQECQRIKGEAVKITAALMRAEDDAARKRAEAERDRIVAEIRQHELQSGHRVA